MQPSTPTAPARPRAPRPKAKPQAIAAFSPTAQRLIEQLQAEAQAATLQALSAKDGITVLHGLDAKTVQWSFWCWGNDGIEGIDGQGCSVDLYKRRHLPDCWRGGAMEAKWHPSYWYGSIRLVDGLGHQWCRQFNCMVCNDFGDLVAVAGGNP